MTSSLDQQCVDTLCLLSIDAVQKAASGHPGMPMGTAPGEDVMREYGFNVDNVCARARALLRR